MFHLIKKQLQMMIKIQQNSCFKKVIKFFYHVVFKNKLFQERIVSRPSFLDKMLKIALNIKNFNVFYINFKTFTIYFKCAYCSKFYTDLI